MFRDRELCAKGVNLLQSSLSFKLIWC